MFPGLTSPFVVPVKLLVRLVLFAVSAASVVVGAIVTLPLATRLVGEVTDAVSGFEAFAAEALVVDVPDVVPVVVGFV
jgi:ABC-type transport system involved in cytochrome bd biosynthesis fused ATPase/permease subunit